MIHRVAYSTSTRGSFDDCLTDCLKYVHTQTENNALLGVVFFINASNQESYRKATSAISTAIDRQFFLFPYNVLAQPGNEPVSVELWLDDATLNTEYLSFEGIRYTRVHSTYGTSIWGIGLHHKDMGAGIQEQANNTFRLLYELLRNEDMSLSDIVRQWNYVPAILDIKHSFGKSIQHYQAFNDVRKHWYAKALFTEGYPAATGIGVKTGPFSIDFVAIKSTSLVEKTGLCNPNQENAYQYAQHHLVGDALDGQQKNPPLFERAKLLDFKENSLITISGTAAIIGQETVGLGDVRQQTEVAINNMLELVSPAVTRQQKAFRFNYLRVYIKDEANRDTVKSICDTYFPDVSASYVLADVCRNNLLMEIEGEAFA